MRKDLPKPKSNTRQWARSIGVWLFLSLGALSKVPPAVSSWLNVVQTHIVLSCCQKFELPSSRSIESGSDKIRCVGLMYGIKYVQASSTIQSSAG